MRRVALLAAAAVVLFARPGWAITDEEVFRTFRFNFVNPGGRAVAMGGAFIGIADDATAAAANPAGLTNLISPELFTELRLEDADPTSIQATVRDPRGGPDPVLTESKGDPETILHPSFISFVKPFKHWVLGVSRQEVLNTRTKADNLFTDKPKFPTTQIVRADGRLEALLEDYNISAAFRAGEKFAAGVTGTYSRLRVDSRTDNFFNYGSGLVSDYSTAVDDSDDDVTFSAGVLIKPVEKLRIGLVYRRGAQFNLREDILDTRPAGNFPSAPLLADFLGNRNLGAAAGVPFGIAPSTFDDPLSFNNRFHVPDQYGIGFGIQPTQALTVAVDAVRIQYSELEDGFVGNVNALTFPGDPYTCDLASPRPDGSFPCDYKTPIATYNLDDATIYHLGLEYIWTIKDKMPFAARIGAYNDPRVRLAADFPPGGVFIADDTTFPQGTSRFHYTAGVGFVIQDKFQADFAADLSQTVKTYVASIIYHF